MKHKIYLTTMIILTLVFISLTATAQSGGDFEIIQTVIGGGGETSSDTGGTFSLDSTIGQPVAETDLSSGGLFNLRTGFRTPAPFAPSAAGLTVSGRVLLANNTGIGDVFVTISGGTLTAPLRTRTSSFGYFSFDDVEAGHFYVINVYHLRYFFAQSSQTFTLTDNINGLVFTSDS